MLIPIPVRTICCHVAAQKKQLEIAQNNARTNTNKLLLQEDELKILITAIVNRNLANNGMSRKKIIQWISVISGCGSYKKCENHWDYLI